MSKYKDTRWLVVDIMWNVQQWVTPNRKPKIAFNKHHKINKHTHAHSH